MGECNAETCQAAPEGLGLGAAAGIQVHIRSPGVAMTHAPVGLAVPHQPEPSAHIHRPPR
jgi:hypothetical protein